MKGITESIFPYPAYIRKKDQTQMGRMLFFTLGKNEVCKMAG